jgi:hypothetical protein
MRLALRVLLCLLALGGPASSQSVTPSFPLGQVVASQVGSGSAVTLASAVASNVTSVSLTAGTWLCGGGIGFLAGNTAATVFEGGFSNTTGTAPTYDGLFFLASSSFTLSGQNFAVGNTTVAISGPGTLFMTAVVNFAGTAWKAYGTETCVRIQ